MWESCFVFDLFLSKTCVCDGMNNSVFALILVLFMGVQGRAVTSIQFAGCSRRHGVSLGVGLA